MNTQIEQLIKNYNFVWSLSAAYKEEYDRGFVEYEEYQQEIYNKLIKYIDKMTKSELKDELLSILNDCPEWIYDIFVNEHLDDL